MFTNSAATPNTTPTRAGKSRVVALNERYVKNKQEKSESLGKDKIESSGTTTLNILVDNDRSYTSEAILSESKNEKARLPRILLL